MQVVSKLFRILILSLFCLSFSNAQNGIFLGLDVGDNINNEDFLKASSPLDSKSGFNPAVGVKLGYQYYFTNFLGLRMYAGAMYLNMKKSITYNQAGGAGPISSEGDMEYNGFSFNGNIDLLLKYDFNQNFGLGIYGGIGYEGTFFKDTNVAISANDLGANELFGKLKNINGNGLIYNVGIQILIASNHQLEVGAKFAPYDIHSTSELRNRNGNITNLGADSNTKLGTLVFVGYRYLFNFN